VVSFTPLPLYPRGKSHPVGWADSRAGLDDLKNILALTGLELLSLSRPALSQPLYRLSYPGSFNNINKFIGFFN
jgi:hypothetical protein